MTLSPNEVDAVTIAVDPARPHVAFAIVGDAAKPLTTDAGGGAGARTAH